MQPITQGHSLYELSPPGPRNSWASLNINGMYQIGGCCDFPYAIQWLAIHGDANRLAPPGGRWAGLHQVPPRLDQRLASNDPSIARSAPATAYPSALAASSYLSSRHLHFVFMSQIFTKASFPFDPIASGA
jgi:hypothetical protein